MGYLKSIKISQIEFSVVMELSSEYQILLTAKNSFSDHNLIFFSRQILYHVLPTFCRVCKDSPPNDCLLNAITNTLARHSDEFHNADFCSLIFDQFLFTWLPTESALHHCLRLLWLVHAKIEGGRMVQLLTITQPRGEVSLIRL